MSIAVSVLKGSSPPTTTAVVFDRKVPRSRQLHIVSKRYASVKQEQTTNYENT